MPCVAIPAANVTACCSAIPTSKARLGKDSIIYFKELPEGIAHYDFGFVKPLDEITLHSILKIYQRIITIEEGVIKGGFGSAIVEFAMQHDYSIPIETLGVPDEFIEHGTVEELHSICGIDVGTLEKKLSKFS